MKQIKPDYSNHSITRIITVTWLLLALLLFSCAGSASSQKGKTPRNVPQDVKEFIERRDRCDQWRAEDMSNPETASGLINKMMKDCHGTDFELKNLRRKYKDNAKVIEILSKYKDNVESNK